MSVKTLARGASPFRELCFRTSGSPEECSSLDALLAGAARLRFRVARGAGDGGPPTGLDGITIGSEAHAGGLADAAGLVTLGRTCEPASVQGFVFSDERGTAATCFGFLGGLLRTAGDAGDGFDVPTVNDKRV